MSELVTLAKEALKEKLGELKPSEIYLLEQVEKGEPADYRTGDKEKDNPSNAKDWGDERTIRAKVIEWLCTDNKAVPYISHRGVIICGAKIIKRINLIFAVVDFPLILDYSSISGGVN